MNAIDDIITPLGEQKAATKRALKALLDFDRTGSITPGKSTDKAAGKCAGAESGLI